MLRYINGDATAPTGSGITIIAHICNDIGKWGKGFVLAISNKWKLPELLYKEWHKAEYDFGLGKVQLVQVSDTIYIANIIGQHGIYPYNGIQPIRYDAVEQGLCKVAEYAKSLNASVHMPRIGCGLAGGKWDIIEPIIVKTLIDENIDVNIYDL